jgi:hypothetical protein
MMEGYKNLRGKAINAKFCMGRGFIIFTIEKHVETLPNCFTMTPCIIRSFNYYRLLLQGFSFFAPMKIWNVLVANPQKYLSI